jgi:N-methylhydantoinase A
MFEEDAGRIAVWKVPSTPDDSSRGITQGVDEGMRLVEPDQPEAGGAISYFGHGTTVATNSLIQHRGARVGLITTSGFRDLLEIGRQKRPSLYDMFAEKPKTLVPRHLRFEVAERLLHDGRVETPLDTDAVRFAARALRDQHVEAVAICFLYSFVNPVHEQQARKIVEDEMPNVFICASHEIAPEFREFERLSTTVVNAYLGPIMHNYISRLTPRLQGLSMKATPHLTQSNGGVVGFEAAARTPVRAVLSGPSTGVVAAEALGRAAGFPDLITFDMGGTSSDVALMKGGRVSHASEAIVHGYPIKAPMIDIHTVGAGGGSIAAIDSGGLLKVGPQSAGADPGPVCYGKGASEPTVTDANIVLRILNPTHLLDGRMEVRRDLAEQAVADMAGRLGLGVMETAQGILSVVTANMARAIRVISVQRGHDPRDYALMAFGGAGPLHAARLAKELEIRRVVVPRNPGILCAMGLLLTDLRADFASTRLIPVEDGAASAIKAALAPVEAQAEQWFGDEAIEHERRRMIRTVDMRYEGQNYELSIPVPDGPIDAGTLSTLSRSFAEAHERLYGFVAEGERVCCVTFRVEALGLVRKAELPDLALTGGDPATAVTGMRDVWFPEAGGFVSTPVYARTALAPGMEFSGPAIIEQMDTTTLAPPQATVRVDGHENLILELK